MNDDIIQVRKLKNIIQSSVIFVEETAKKKFDCQAIFCHLARNKKRIVKKFLLRLLSQRRSQYHRNSYYRH